MCIACVCGGGCGYCVYLPNTHTHTNKHSHLYSYFMVKGSIIADLWSWQSTRAMQTREHTTSSFNQVAKKHIFFSIFQIRFEFDACGQIVVWELAEQIYIDFPFFSKANNNNKEQIGKKTKSERAAINNWCHSGSDCTEIYINTATTTNPIWEWHSIEYNHISHAICALSLILYSSSDAVMCCSFRNIDCRMGWEYCKCIVAFALFTGYFDIWHCSLLFTFDAFN